MKGRRKGKESTTAKGRLFETVVAGMYDKHDVKVEQNVYLEARCRSSNKKRKKREIDILITGWIAGQQVRIAIECKNWEKKIGSPDIDGFIGKLSDVGIPIGIYVSASGYTPDAIEYAKEKGIATLILKEATREAVADSIKNAAKSLIYLLLNVKSIEFVNEYDQQMNGYAFILYDFEHSKSTTIPDIIWHEWLENRIPSELGNYHIEIKVPDNYKQFFDNRPIKLLSASAEVQVIGLVFTEYGSSKEYSLIDAVNDKLKKYKIDVIFNNSSNTFPAEIISTEDELIDISKRSNSIDINLTIGRFRLPKMVENCCYWPPSERVYKKITNLMQAYHLGKIPDPRPLSLTEIEGTCLNSMWEPVWEGHKDVQIDSNIICNINKI
jgi:hypothetical protein